MSKSKYSGGIDQLRQVSEAADEYEAMGLWWAWQICLPSFENGQDVTALSPAKQLVRSERDERAIRRAREVTINHASGFALALTDLLREKGDHPTARCDYTPDTNLRKAAEMAGMPLGPGEDMSVFPWKHKTFLYPGSYDPGNEIRVMALSGDGHTVHQIWPPTDDTPA
jgi:hypothetical protein